MTRPARSRPDDNHRGEIILRAIPAGPACACARLQEAHAWLWKYNLSTTTAAINSGPIGHCTASVLISVTRFGPARLFSCFPHYIQQGTPLYEPQARAFSQRSRITHAARSSLPPIIGGSVPSELGTEEQDQLTQPAEEHGACRRTGVARPW